MKAVLCEQFGPPSSLVVKEVPSLQPGPGQVVVAVHAASVNFPDGLIIENKYQFKPTLPFSPGGEVAGTVKALGPGVSGWAVGDRVIGVCGWGGFADEVVVTAVYAAREDPEPGVTSELITRRMSRGRYVADRHEAAAVVAGAARPGDLVLTMGAGDVTDLADEIVGAL